MNLVRAIFTKCVLPLLALMVLLPAYCSASDPVDGPSDSSRLPQVEKINELVEIVWTDFEITPSKPATDGEWCRRVYLDLIGRIPKVEELREFVGDKSPDKREKLVEKLLYDDELSLIHI